MTTSSSSDNFPTARHITAAWWPPLNLPVDSNLHEEKYGSDDQLKMRHKCVLCNSHYESRVISGGFINNYFTLHKYMSQYTVINMVIPLTSRIFPTN
jgi:hypothetical protein